MYVFPLLWFLCLIFASLKLIKFSNFFDFFLSSFSFIVLRFAQTSYSFSIRWNSIFIITANIFKSIHISMILLLISNLWREKLQSFSVILSQIILIVLIIIILHILILNFRITEALLIFIHLVVWCYVLLNLRLIELIRASLEWLLLVFLVLCPVSPRVIRATSW